MSAGVRFLGDGDEQAVVEARVLASQRVARMHALLARRRDDVTSIPSDANGKLLERCLFRKQQQARPPPPADAHSRRAPHVSPISRSPAGPSHVR